MPSTARTTLVFGAAGLIGQYLTADLRHRGFRVVGVARHFATGPRRGPTMSSCQIMSMRRRRRLPSRTGKSTARRDRELSRRAAGWAWQRYARRPSRFCRTDDPAVRQSGRDVRLIHVSMPGRATDDHTPFSRTKREAERLIRSSGLRHVILRPGFVIAPAPSVAARCARAGGAAIRRWAGARRACRLRRSRSKMSPRLSQH